MFAPGQNQLLANLSLLLFFKDLSIVRFYDFKRTFEECVSLFSYQRSVLHCRLSQTALLLYHAVSCLSRTFFNFFEVVLLLSCSNFGILSHPTGCCQELFSFLFDSFVISMRSLRRNSDRIPLYTWFVNSYFHVFLFFCE